MEISESILFRKIQCLKWILADTGWLSLAEDLHVDRVLSFDQLQTMKGHNDPVENLFTRLKLGVDADTVQLVSYEWTMLPEMRAKVVIVTNFRTMVLERKK